jgi:hypothetical protein
MTREPVVPPTLPTVECSVRFVAGPDPIGVAGGGPHLSRAVAERAGPWAERVAQYVRPHAPVPPILITLYGGRCVPRTKGAEILLPASDGPAAVLSGLAHELVHAVAGRSPHPLLNEGLAVHVDSELQLAGPSWPFYHLPPDRWMQAFGENGWMVPLAELLSAATVPPRTEDHLSVRARAVHYLHAASYTGHLLARLPRPAFWAAFHAGQPVPGGRDIGAIERDWLHGIADHALTADERERRDRSFGISSHDHDDSRPQAARAGRR